MCDGALQLRARIVLKYSSIYVGIGMYIRQTKSREDNTWRVSYNTYEYHTPSVLHGYKNRISCLLLCLASCFSFVVFLFFKISYFFLHPGMFYLFRVPSSVQQPSATLSKYVFYSTFSFCLLSFVSYLIAESFCFFIRVVFLFSFS